jgi:hypothetical protein
MASPNLVAAMKKVEARVAQRHAHEALWTRFYDIALSAAFDPTSEEGAECVYWAADAADDALHEWLMRMGRDADC